MNATNCDDISDLLEPFTDGELAMAEQETVAFHLRDCAKCRQEVDGLRELHGKLQRLVPYKAPADLAGRIGDKLAAARSTEAGRSSWRGWGIPLATHLAAVLIGLAAGYWLLLAGTQSDSLSRELVAAHVRSLMAARPIDVASGDPHRVGPWFAGKLDFAPKVRDLAAEGFPLAGGRVDYFEGRRVAVLVYSRREHVINVFVMPRTGQFLRNREFRRNGYNAAAWSDGEYDYWAVSDLNRTELAALAGLLGAS
jgi:anti-sigma factor RsiW